MTIFSKFRALRVTRNIAGMTALAVTLAACEPVPGGGAGLSSASAPLPRVSFNDSCAPLRQPFASIRAERDKIIGQNVAAGALAGGLLAAALGGNSDQIFAGVVVGGLGGVANAYAQNAASRGATDRSLAAFASRDARREAAQNDSLVGTLLKLNACRLDQAENIATQARAGKIGEGQAKALLRQVALATRGDNRVVNSVAGNRRTYDAYVGVLTAKDVAAANRTRTSVANYKPKVRKVTRTSRGRAAISAGSAASGATSTAQARNSAVRLDAVNDAHVESIEALIGSLDISTPT